MITESFFENAKDAHEAARRLRAQSLAQDSLIRVEDSPYGGFVLRVIPADIAMDFFDIMPGLLGRRIQ